MGGGAAEENADRGGRGRVDFTLARFGATEGKAQVLRVLDSSLVS